MQAATDSHNAAKATNEQLQEELQGATSKLGELKDNTLGVLHSWSNGNININVNIVFKNKK